MGRNLLAVVLGMIIAVVVIVLFEVPGSVLHPLPRGVELDDKQAIAEHISKAPLAVKLLVLMGYATASCVGGFVASRISSSPEPTTALIVGALVLLASLANLAILPHPGWFVALNAVLPLPAAYFGCKVFRRPKPLVRIQ
jgi:hypothetical protein